jgi:hypothetical protein
VRPRLSVPFWEGGTPHLQVKPSGGLWYVAWDGHVLPGGPHRYELRYHFVFTTKYRKPVLRGEIAVEVRELIRQICRSSDVNIPAGHVRPDHVHLLLSVPPHLAPSRVMQAIKGRLCIIC